MTEERIFDRDGTRFIVKLWSDDDKVLLSYFANHVLLSGTHIEDIYKWLTEHDIFYTVNYRYISGKILFYNLVEYIRYRLSKRKYYLSRIALRKAAMNDELMSDILSVLEDEKFIVREI